MTQKEKDKLLAKAREDYLPGTVFKPAHTNDGEVIVEEGDILFDNLSCKVSGYPWILLQDNTKMTKLAKGSSHNANLYYKGKWAEIISLPSKVEEWSVGTYLVIIESNYAGHNYRLTSLPKLEKGKVGKIQYKYEGSFTAIEEHDMRIEKSMCKWFATKEEAEAFAKTLVELPERGSVLPKESDLDKWLRETKARNFSTKELTNFINGNTTPFLIYNKLEGNRPTEKAKILNKKWGREEIIKSNEISEDYRQYRVGPTGPPSPVGILVSESNNTFQEPVIIKRNKKKQFKLITITQ